MHSGTLSPDQTKPNQKLTVQYSVIFWLKWSTTFPLSLLKIRASTSLAPFELTFGSAICANLTESSYDHIQYLKGVLSPLESLRYKVIKIRKVPLEEGSHLHPSEISSTVCLVEEEPSLSWEGPFPVFLVIHSDSKVKQKWAGLMLSL
jgi:hypothetical protein